MVGIMSSELSSAKPFSSCKKHERRNQTSTNVLILCKLGPDTPGASNDILGSTYRS